MLTSRKTHTANADNKKARTSEKYNNMKEYCDELILFFMLKPKTNSYI